MHYRIAQPMLYRYGKPHHYAYEHLMIGKLDTACHLQPSVQELPQATHNSGLADKHHLAGGSRAILASSSHGDALDHRFEAGNTVVNDTVLLSVQHAATVFWEMRCCLEVGQKLQCQVMLSENHNDIATTRIEHRTLSAGQ